ncbi:uncharacterized protein LOC119387885 isoform X3 [Rhipicephalus sanguineus]|uniref:uncharacterized protein LOC119387885 isoform X3 n=1 Tax=Rhipicephalus sanguineus TaxID=34632 RepID=UPI0020C4401F|nr:uncharacterized protein LOC119387885 isoform X3 [Rhipicephalus sanguineus]
MGAVVDRSHLRRCVICAPPFVKSWCQWHNASSLSLSTERFGAKVAAVIPVAPMVNEQVDRVLEPGVLCDVISTIGCVEPLRDFYIWNRTWWFWPEFYGGEISGLGNGLKRRGDCAFELGNAHVANCDIGHAKLWVRYLWRVGFKNRKLEEGDQQANPRALIEQGFLMATVAEGTMRMKLKRDTMYGKFRVHRVTSSQTEIETWSSATKP